jgi:hypothetical protein
MVAGFRDLNGENVKFDRVYAGDGDFGEMPRALLVTLAKGYRRSGHYGDQDVISVTTLIDSPQIARLHQRHEVFVEPLDGLWTTFGSVAHALFENGASDQDIVEHKLVVDFEGTKIGGTFDLLELQQPARTAGGITTPAVYSGKDWKVTSSYSIEKMLGGDISWNGEKYTYFWQAQVYKWMIGRPDVQQVITECDMNGQPKRTFLEPWDHAGSQIDSWNIVAICRNWSARNHKRKIGAPVRVIPVEPLLEDHRIENYLRERTAVWGLSGMCEDHDLPDCSPVENWNGRRCEDWCDVAPYCHQKAGTKGQVA